METSQLIEILERPVRNCEMAHENVRRNKDTLLPISTLLTPECDAAGKHVGCFHLLQVLLHKRRHSTSDKFAGVLGQILIENGYQKVLELLESQREKLETLDEEIRICRTGGPAGPDSIDQVPLKEVAEERIKPLLIRHERIIITGLCTNSPQPLHLVV